MSPNRRLLPSLNALRAFEAAARLESFKDAAVELGVTHGAISRHVSLLEEWLGPPVLFARLNRRLELTPTGAALLAEVGPALDRLSAAAGRHRARAGKSAPAVLRVNALATFTLRWLLPRLAGFRDLHPEIEVRLSTSNEPVDALHESHDLIIRGGPDTFYGFSCRPFLTEYRVPVCSPTLLKRLPLREVTDLRQHTLLHASTLPRVWGDWLSAAGAQDLQPAGSLTLDHFYLTLQAALDGLGVAMGPTPLITDDVAAGRLVVPFSSPVLPTRGYHTYLPDARSRDRSVTAFCAWLVEMGRLDASADAFRSRVRLESGLV
ncbi:LysR substrate-binding domain-containing protein [Bradyrhizobium sp. 26S5]|uniref:LysR substrate-binding domain-containing protein n=1 Tax=Bradyrhizobium sp. 26S5 TaxID=3139729 RepID=UPI0030D3F140